jgi:hypothetical protein
VFKNFKLNIRPLFTFFSLLCFSYFVFVFTFSILLEKSNNPELEFKNVFISSPYSTNKKEKEIVLFKNQDFRQHNSNYFVLEAYEILISFIKSNNNLFIKIFFIKGKDNQEIVFLVQSNNRLLDFLSEKIIVEKDNKYEYKFASLSPNKQRKLRLTYNSASI